MIKGFLGVWNFHFQDFFRVGNFGRSFFGWQGLIREFWGYSKQSEDSCSDCISWPHTSATKHKVTTKLVFPSYIIYCFLEIFKARKFSMGIIFCCFFWVWGFGGGGEVNFWSTDFFGFWFLPPFDHPCPLKSLNKHLHRMHASLKKTPTFYKMDNSLEWTQMTLEGLIGTSWPNQSSCKANSTINQACPAKSVYL